MTLSNPALRRLLSGCQNHRCAYCGFTMALSIEEAREIVRPFARRTEKKHRRAFEAAAKARLCTIEHVTSKSEGGQRSRENLVAACAWCNAYRASVPVEWALRRIRRLLRNKSHPHITFMRNGSWWAGSNLHRR